MNAFNYPVTSREYKFMLNTDRFKDREMDSGVFLNLIEFLIQKGRQNGKNFQINLRYRSSDRYLAADQDLSSSQNDKKSLQQKV